MKDDQRGIQEIIDDLTAFKDEKKVLFTTRKASNGNQAQIYLNLHGNIEVHHGTECVLKTVQPLQAVEYFKRL